MCNEKKENIQEKYSQDMKDYRLIIYRLDQLESEQKESFRELTRMLQTMQEHLNTHSERIIELSQRQVALEDKINTMDSLNELAAKHTTEIANIDRRLGIYQAVLIGVTISLVAAICLGVIRLL